MGPDPAELARTLAAGRLRGVAHMAGAGAGYAVRHVVEAHGDVLLLVAADGELAAALRADEDAGLALAVDDALPGLDAPGRGRVWLAGWAQPLDGEPARAAAVEFAATDPAGELLDVGAGYLLVRLNVAEVWLDRDGELIDVAAADYAAAEPDPLYAHEADLLADLDDHHGDAVAAMLAHVGIGGPGRVVRLDRHGLAVATDDGRLARLSFPRPVDGMADLAELLHPVMCPVARRRATGRGEAA